MSPSLGGNTDGSTHAFVEWLPNNGTTYTCILYSQEPGGTDWNFNVYVNSSGWNVKIDGSVDPDGPWNLGFGDGTGYIGGELALQAGGSSSASEACYGQGASGWNVYSGPTDGGSENEEPVSLNIETATLLTGFWTIDNAPTPLCDHSTP